MTKMIPPVPTSAVMLPTPKQKIGFSIESIVGNNNANANANAAVASPPTTENRNNNNSINTLESVAVGTTSLGSPGSVGGGLGLGTIQNDALPERGTSAGPTSPPQTPPAGPASAITAASLLAGRDMSAHLPLALTPHHHHHHHHHQQQHIPPHHHPQQQHHHPQSHPHLPHHLTPAQQHALHQHLLLQQSRFQPGEASPPLRPDIQDILQRLHNSAAVAAANLSLNVNGPYIPPAAAPATLLPPTPTTMPQQTRLSPEDGGPEAIPLHLKRDRSPIPAGLENVQNPAQRHQPPHTPPKSVSPMSSQPSPPPPPPPALIGGPLQVSACGGSPGGSPHHQPHPHPQLQQPYGKQAPSSGPIMLPGLPPTNLIRPYALGPGGGGVGGSSGGPQGPQTSMPDIKSLPPYINAPPELQAQHNPHLIAAAQFQMAAALQAGHVLGPAAAAAAAAAGLPPHAGPFMPGPPGMPRDSYPLYPWLLSRHGRIFPHRFPGNFLLQPFRKPKRIRTAFSPSQLLKLEHAFESNQYVVGAERKALAQSLNLSETQVKVWFQNRRTKHKRMQQEDEKGGSQGGGGSDKNSHNTSGDEDDDDELIDMEMDDCMSDEEHELDASH